jgi:Peptidase family M28
MRMSAVLALILIAVFSAHSAMGQAQVPATPQLPAVPPGAPPRPAPEPAHARTAELVWNLAPADQKYASINGADLKQFVADQTAISRRYRDQGHQFWGRIIGTSADAENAQWLMDKFKEFGLSDVHEIPIDLNPQWMPQSWSVSASANGTTLNIETAQPTYLSPGTSPDGLDLEAVFVGSGSAAELNLAKDVKGKAVFFVTPDLTSRHAPTGSGSIKRIADRGAAAIFVIVPVPLSNNKTQFYPVGTQVPTFTLGQKDGFAVRDMIGQDPSGPAVHVKVKMDVQMVPNEKTGTVWGVLPGATDETVYVIAHRDGWFEGADDNAAGVATMLGMAQYFSKFPKAQRKRTIIFIGSTGHHGGPPTTGQWLSQHPEMFAKTAIIFNCEHTGLKDYVWSFSVPDAIKPTDAIGPLTWYVGGTPKLLDIASKAFDDFGVPTEADSMSAPPGDIGGIYWYAPSIQLLDTGYTWHSDHETDDTISASGLAAVARAYAKIIVETNSLPLKDLRRELSGQGSGN